MWDEAVPRAPRPCDYKVKPKASIANKEEPVKAKPGSEQIEPKKVVKEEKESDSKRSQEVSVKERPHDNTSFVDSLPDSNESASKMYVDNLLERIQKHIHAST